MRLKSAVLSPSIVTSSIWTEPSDIRVVWITLLALATKSGKVAASIKKLAELSNVTREVAAQAVEIFSNKDERSRDKDGDGRRIEILADGFRIINFDKYNEPPQKPEKIISPGSSVVIDYSVIQAIKYEWFKQYKTEIHDIRIRRELNELGGENPSELCKAFRSYIKGTPPKFFSWQKFRDIWRSFLEPTEAESSEVLFDRLAKSHTGYSASVGVFWTSSDVKNKFGEKVAEAFDRIGGDAKLRSMTQTNIPFIKREFVAAYGK